MSDLNPAEVFRRYRRGELGAAAAVDYLKTIIESGSTAVSRVQSIKFIGKVGIKSHKLFEFLEHLVTSDESEEIRLASIVVIIHDYLGEGVNLLKWVFKHEESIIVLLSVLKSLQSSNASKSEDLILNFKITIENRFSQINDYMKEEMGIGQIERFLGIIQPHLTDPILYEDLDIIILDRLFDEIVELVESRIITDKDLIAKIMLLLTDRYLAEGEMEHDWHETWLLYQKAMIASEFGLVFDPRDKELLFNYGVSCNYLDLYYPAIKAFLRLYKIQKKTDKKKYKKLKRMKKQGSRIVGNEKSGPLYYLAELYAKTGMIKKQNWAIQQNKKRKKKFRKLKTDL